MMKFNKTRFKAASKAATIHFFLGLVIACLFAWLVFSIWYPYPYRALAGGVELFTIIIAIDLVCGPLLTFVLFSPYKAPLEICTDLCFVVAIQITALSYGVWTVWQTRPIFVVHETDHLNITARVNVETNQLAALPIELTPIFFGGPIMASLRSFTVQEQNSINADIKNGGRDRSERPMYYIKFDGVKAYQTGFSLSKYLQIHPESQKQISILIGNTDANNLSKFKYLPIVGRIYWLAIYDESGKNWGFIELND
jgi:hypothetical protein